MAKDTLNNSVFNNMILIVSEPMSREGGASALRGPSLCCRMTLLSFSPFSLAELASWAGSKHRVKTGGVSAVFTFSPSHTFCTTGQCHRRIAGRWGRGWASRGGVKDGTLKELCCLYPQVGGMSGRVGDLSPKQAEALEQVSFIIRRVW